MMKSKMFLVMVVLLVSASFVFAISSEEGEGSTEGELTTVGDGINPICNEAIGEWEVGDETFGCEFAGETCCAEGFSCVDGGCVGGVVSNCGVFETRTECTGSPESEFVYDTIAGELLEQGINIDADELVESDFCDDEDQIFVYEPADDECVILKGPCECEWVDNTCVDTNAEIRVEESCDGIDDVDEIPSNSDEFECQRSNSELENLCDTQGHYLLEWTGKLVDASGNDADPLTSPSCDDGSRTFSCPAEGVEVPFFTMFNFFATLAFIVGGYMVIVMFRRR
jgi:hypothetical protein